MGAQVLRRLGVVSVITAIGLSMGATASAASEGRPARDVAVKVVAVDPSGTPLIANLAAEGIGNGASLGPWQGNQQDVILIPPGTYVIAADIYTIGAGDQPISQTMIAVVRDVSHDATVTFNTARGKLVSASVGVAGATAQSANATICGNLAPLSGAPYFYPVMYSSGDTLPVYAVPNASKYLQFNYAADFAAGGTQYYVDGQTPRGIPASPHYAFRASQFASLTLQARTGTIANEGEDYWEIDPASSCGLYGFMSSRPVSLPPVQSQYVSAGPWAAQLFAEGCSGGGGLEMRGTYRARRGYLDVFGVAATGPADYLPQIDTGSLFFQDSDLLADPNTGMEACPAEATATLSGPGMRKRPFRLGPSFGITTLHRTGWYDLDVIATPAPVMAGGTAPSLSTRVTLSWHFDVPSLDLELLPDQSMPVSLTTFVPAGLDLANDAAPGGATTVRIELTRRSQTASASLQYKLRSVSVQASDDNGTSWQQLRVTQHGGYWLVTVPDPASGYVSLRSIVTDVRGDSTVETIYRAYGIS
jgi:hypothetical protein